MMRLLSFRNCERILTEQMKIKSAISIFNAVMCSGLLLLSLFASAPANADDSAASAVSTGSAGTGYGIEPGDELTITIINFPDVPSITTVVPRDGNISLSLIGQYQVAGETTEEITKKLTAKYSVFLIRPIVTVALTNKHLEVVSVGGSVTRPGTVNFKPGMRLIESIIDAGGPNATADLSNVTVVDADGTRRSVDLSNLDSKEGTSYDLPLSEDDAVYVPISNLEVNVVGQLKDPGSFPFRERLNVLDAITLAGGVTDSADLANATITNGTTVTPIDLSALIRKGDMSNNIALKPGDTLSIPLVARNYVFGDVNKPGYYPFLPGDRVLDALNGAGGATPTANTSKVYVIHFAQGDQTAKSKLVDLTKFFKTADMSQNLLLSPGDIVYVSDRKRPADYSPLFAVLGIANMARYL